MRTSTLKRHQKGSNLKLLSLLEDLQAKSIYSNNQKGRHNNRHQRDLRLKLQDLVQASNQQLKNYHQIRENK